MSSGLSELAKKILEMMLIDNSPLLAPTTSGAPALAPALAPAPDPDSGSGSGSTSTPAPALAPAPDVSAPAPDVSASGTSGSDTGAPAPAPGPDVSGSGTSADPISITIKRYNNDKTDDTSANDLYYGKRAILINSSSDLTGIKFDSGSHTIVREIGRSGNKVALLVDFKGPDTDREAKEAIDLPQTLSLKILRNGIEIGSKTQQFVLNYPRLAPDFPNKKGNGLQTDGSWCSISGKACSRSKRNHCDYCGFIFHDGFGQENGGYHYTETTGLLSGVKKQNKMGKVCDRCLGDLEGGRNLVKYTTGEDPLDVMRQRLDALKKFGGSFVFDETISGISGDNYGTEKIDAAFKAKFPHYIFT